MYDQGQKRFLGKLLLNTKVKELSRESQKSVVGTRLEQMDKGIDTLIQPGRRLFHRAEDALMKFSGHGYPPDSSGSYA